MQEFLKKLLLKPLHFFFLEEVVFLKELLKELLKSIFCRPSWIILAEITQPQFLEELLGKALLEFLKIYLSICLLHHHWEFYYVVERSLEEISRKFTREIRLIYPEEISESTQWPSIINEQPLDMYVQNPLFKKQAPRSGLIAYNIFHYQRRSLIDKFAEESNFLWRQNIETLNKKKKST